MDNVAVVLAAIGAINWGLIGLFGFDLVAKITTAGKFGDRNVISRIVYAIVGIGGAIALGGVSGSALVVGKFGDRNVISRIIYVLVGISGGIALFNLFS